MTAAKVGSVGVVWAVGVALASLTLYVLLMGYHREPHLMMVVVLVRLAAGLGVGLGIATLVSVVQLIRKKPGITRRFVNSSLLTGSITVTLLVLVNLLQT